MNGKILIAVAAAIVVVAAGCSAFFLMNGDKDSSNVLTIDSEGTYENGTYDSVIISSSVGNGSVLLKNIKILKELTIRGGGSHSVTLDGCTNEGTTTVDKEGGEDVRINLVGTTLTSVEANSNVILESDSNSAFQSVVLNGADAAVQGESTKVDKMEMKGDSSLDVKDGTVGSVTVAADATATVQTSADGTVGTTDVTGSLTVQGTDTNLDTVKMNNGSAIDVQNGSVGNITIDSQASVTIGISDNGEVKEATVGDSVKISTTGTTDMGTVDINMADGAQGSGVTINDVPQHIHKYEFTMIDWSTLSQDATGGYTVKATYTCSACEAGDAGHTEQRTLAVSSDRTEPTCTDDGRIHYYVPGTGDNGYNEILTALGHDLEHHDAKAATCTEEGWNAYDVCKREGCQYSTKVTVPALGHDIVHHDAQAATCTEAGWEAYDECSRGDYSTKQEIPATGHGTYSFDHIDWTTLRKETSGEYTVEIIKACGNCTEETEGHFIRERMTATQRIQPATCTEAGYEHYIVPNTGDNGYRVNIPALGHDLEHHDAKAATCTEEGWNAYDTCKREGCQYSTKETIDALGHDPIEHPAQEATCTSDGWGIYHTCTRCDWTDKQTIPALPHNYEIVSIDWNTLDKTNNLVTVQMACTTCEVGDEGHTTTQSARVSVNTALAPTCTTGGTIHYYVAGFNDGGHDEDVDALGHDIIEHEAKAPTCTEVGWNAYETCSRCNHSTYDEIPALGHDLVHHDAKPPSTTESGWDAYDTCSRCDYTTQVIIPPIRGFTVSVSGGLAAVRGDTPEDSIIVVPENTVVTVVYDGEDPNQLTHWTDNYGDYIPGTSFDVLVTCDLFFTAHEVGKLTYGEWVHEIEPTCTEDGLWTRSAGDFTEYMTIPALGHMSDGNLVVDTPATCTAAGEGHTVCERCHEDIVEVIPATGHDHVFTVEIQANGSAVGKLKGECSVCHDIVYQNYISPIYPSGDMVVKFKWSHVRDVELTDREETHTMWTFTDANDIQRQAYLFKIQLDRHKNGYINGVDNTSWFFWADYGEHSPVYVARHNGSVPSYGGTTETSWSVAGYVDNLAEFIYLIDTLDVAVTIGGQECGFGLGMDNGRDASALYDLYDAWADVYNAGKAGLYQSRAGEFRGWDVTIYYNDDESFYVDENNCCLFWGRSNMINGIERGDQLQIVSITEMTEETVRPFTAGYNDYPQFAGYYFPNSMPTLEDTTYSCITVLNGTYSSSDFIQASSGRINFYNADSRGLAMTWITPNLPAHHRMVRIDVLDNTGTWIPVPTTTYIHNGVTYYGFDLQDPTINGLYTYMMSQYPTRFVMPDDPSFNGIYLNCVTELVPPDSAVTVSNGTFSVDFEGEYVASGQVYGNEYIYLEFEERPGKIIESIRVTIDGVTNTVDNAYSYRVPADSTVAIEPVYEDVPDNMRIHLEFRCTEGGTIDIATGDFVAGTPVDGLITADFGYLAVGWYDITDAENPMQVGWGEMLAQYFYDDAIVEARLVKIDPEILASDFTKVLATDGFVQLEDSPVCLSALYGNTELGWRMNVHADPNADTVHRWDIISFAEDPNSQVESIFPADEWFDGDVKYCGEITTVDAVFGDEVEYYTLSYDLNGCEDSIQGGTYADDVYFTVTDFEPEWYGHNFLGWNSAANGSGTTYEAGQSYKLTADLTLYAQWEIDTFTTWIEVPIPSGYYTLDNSGSRTLSVQFGDVCYIPGNLVESKYATITGWTYTLDGNVYTVPANGDASIPYGVETITAVVGSWAQYRIVFDKNAQDAEGDETPVTFDVRDIDLYGNLTLEKRFTRQYYEYSKYLVDGVEKSATDFPVKSIISANGYHGEDIVAQVVWRATLYTLKLEGNWPAQNIQSKGIYPSASLSFSKEADASIPAANNVRATGYNPLWFTTSADGTGTRFDLGQTATFEQLMPFYDAEAKRVYLYAQWVGSEYTIHYRSNTDANYGAMQEQTITYGESGTLATAEELGFTNEDKVFQYWSTDPHDGDGAVHYDGGQSGLNIAVGPGYIELYAIWADA